MERPKARWQNSEDGPDVELKIVTFYVGSRLHGQFFFMWQFLFAT